MPVVKKDVFEFAHGGPGDPEVGVAPAGMIPASDDWQARNIFFAEVQAPGQGIHPVNNDQLAVIAEIKLQAPFPAMNGQKTCRYLTKKLAWLRYGLPSPK